MQCKLQRVLVMESDGAVVIDGLFERSKYIDLDCL